MLRIINTEGLMGIVIKGNYSDLRNLYDALYRMTDLYYANLRDLYFEHIEGYEDLQKRICFLDDRRYFFLNLISRINNVLQGKRENCMKSDAEKIKKDRQLHCIEGSGIDNEARQLPKIARNDSSEYSVEIEYPLAIYFMYSIWDYLCDIFLGEFPDPITIYFKEQFRNYHDRQHVLHQDIGMLMFLYGLLQKTIINAVGTETAEHIFTYVYEGAYINNGVLYPQALCKWLSKMGSCSCIQTKKHMITAMAYELYDCTDQLDAEVLQQSKEDYESAIRNIESSCEISYPKYYLFNDKLRTYVDNLPDGFYEDDFENFLNQEYGQSV